MEMIIFIGRVHKKVELVDEKHPLYWIDINENFFDMTKYAGEGNIGHMIEIYCQLKDKFVL
jgi:8-oxo-dGTP diphosphatase